MEHKKCIIKILSGEAKGKLYKLVGSRISIGRATNADIILQDTNASRIHAYFEIKKDSAVIYDNQSMNGIFVNKRSVKEQELVSGDKILIGDTLLEFLIVDTKTVFEEKSITIKHTPSEDNNLLNPKPLAVIQKIQSYLTNLRSLPGGRRKIIIAVLFASAFFIYVIQNNNTHKESDRDKEAAQKEQSEKVIPGLEADEKKVVTEVPQFHNPLEKKKHINELYTEARVFHDVGKYYEALNLLEKILEVDSQHSLAIIKRNKWTAERDSIAQKLLDEGVRAYNNKYYDLASSYFQKVLDFIRIRNHELYRKAENGILRVEQAQNSE